MCPTSRLDGCEKFLGRDSIPGPSISLRVAIPTELSRSTEKCVKRDQISFTPSRKGRKYFVQFAVATEFCTGAPSTRVGTLIVVTIYLQLIQNRYMFRSFTVLQCSHQHCVQPVASDVEVVGYL